MLLTMEQMLQRKILFKNAAPQPRVVLVNNQKRENVAHAHVLEFTDPKFWQSLEVNWIKENACGRFFVLFHGSSFFSKPHFFTQILSKKPVLVILSCTKAV